MAQIFIWISKMANVGTILIPHGVQIHSALLAIITLKHLQQEEHPHRQVAHQ